MFEHKGNAQCQRSITDRLHPLMASGSFPFKWTTHFLHKLLQLTGCNILFRSTPKIFVYLCVCIIWSVWVLKCLGFLHGLRDLCHLIVEAPGGSYITVHPILWEQFLIERRSDGLGSSWWDCKQTGCGPIVSNPLGVQNTLGVKNK